MKTTQFKSGAWAIVLGMTAVAAQAQETGPADGDRDGARRGMAFADLDRDGDGMLTLDEMTARATARFAAADTNGDGLLSAAELTAAAEARVAARTERMIARMDSDGDGQLSAEEMRGRRDPARMFDRVDADDDGMVSQAEFDAARDRMARHHGGKRGPVGARPGDNGETD